MPKIKQIKFMKTILSQTSQRKLAKELNMSRTGVRRWLSGDNFLPLEAFNILTKKYNLTNYKKYIKKTLPDNWGRKKGGKSNIKKISDLKSYMKRLHENHRKKSRKVKHITEIEFTTPFGLMVKEQKLDPHPFIATMLLTDGHMCLKKNCYEIGYASKNNYELNKIFIELVKLWNNEIVISEYTKNNGVIINYFHLPLQNKLIKISPSYKKSPSKNQTSDEYLRKSQPSLNFLKKLDDVYKILCIRIALSN